MGGVSEWRPIKVSVIDIERCPATISGAPHYCALWALIRERGRPRGIVKIPFTDEALTREQLLAAVATLPPQADAPPAGATPRGELPSISVVIPSLLERRDGLKACLDSLAALNYPNYEVIVVDNRPAGAPPVELAAARVVREPRPGISAARNCGLAAATGRSSLSPTTTLRSTRAGCWRSPCECRRTRRRRA